MRRRGLLTAAGLALAAAAPCGASAQATRWVMASAYPDGNYHTQNLRQFIGEVEAATGGRLAVQLHSNASLLPMPQIKRAIQTGQIQIGEILLAAYGNENPLFEMDFIPFLADTWDKARALNEATEPLLRARFARQGMTLLYVAQWPSQAFYSRTPIERVEDLRGTRFRAQSTTLARLAELVGATPVTVQQAEVPQAFSAGIINVMITSAQTGVDTSAWDFTRYALDMGMMHVRNAVLVNSRAFAALDEATRTALREAAARAQARAPGLAQASERTQTERLRAQGMVTPEPKPEFAAAMRALGERMAEEWAQKAGPEGREALERYRAMVR
jgi:TRAP-type C4-dicarboxylate transport system substrate-binding protein